MKNNTLYLTQASLIAALYVVLTIISNFAGLASGVIQLRLSEMLTILPVFTSAAIPGLAKDPVTLEENEYFMLGDNRDSSEDSRFAIIGNVHRDQSLGKVWFRIVPFSELGFLPELGETKPAESQGQQK